jgi:hypothetical protein
VQQEKNFLMHEQNLEEHFTWVLESTPGIQTNSNDFFPSGKEAFWAFYRSRELSKLTSSIITTT